MLEPSVSIHPLVEELDVPDIAGFIAYDNPDAALRVVREIRDTFFLLASHPQLGVVYHSGSRKLKGIRMLPVSQFDSYLVFYKPMTDDTGVRILYVMHSARDLKAVFERDIRA